MPRFQLNYSKSESKISGEKNLDAPHNHQQQQSSLLYNTSHSRAIQSEIVIIVLMTAVFPPTDNPQSPKSDEPAGMPTVYRPSDRQSQKQALYLST